MLLKSAPKPVAVLSLPLVLLAERIKAGCRVAVADGVEKERPNTVGRVVDAGRVAKERLAPLAVLLKPVVLE